MNTHRLCATRVKHLFFAILWLLIFVISKPSIEAESVSASGTAYQAQEDAQCNAVDVVILIDQSQSMSLINDPNNGRFQAAKSIVDYLGNQAVWLCSDQNIKHRIAVIGFGDRSNLNESGDGEGNSYKEDIETYLESVTIPPTNDFDNWRDDRIEIKAAIDFGKGQDLNATDHLSALLAAADILQEWRDDPLPGDDRRQAVVLITDGEPCLFNRACDVAGHFYNIRPDMEAIEQLTDREEETFPFRGDVNPESVYLSVIALTKRSGAYTNGFLNQWQTIAQMHGSDLFRANPANTDITPLIADAMSPIAGSSTSEVLCNVDIWIDPYVDNLVILYAFALTDNPNEDVQVVIAVESDEDYVTIENGRASSSTIDVADFIQDGQNAVYIFEPPIPGSYQVQVPGSDDCVDKVEVRLDKATISAEVDTPVSNAVFPTVSNPPYHNPQAAEKFRVQFFESNGNPLHEFDGYPLTVRAVIASENGHSEQELILQRVSDGIYESNDFIETPVPGVYAWEVTATVPNPRAGRDDIALADQGDITIFTDSGIFTALEVASFGFALAQPTNGVDFALNTVQGDQQIPQGIPVEVTFLDAAGQPLSALGVFQPDSVNTVLKATLHGSGAANLETIPLLLKPGTNNQIFEGVFTNNDNGFILPAGEYIVEVNAVWSHEDYPILDYAPANDQDSAVINQYEVRPLAIVIHPPEEGEELTLHEESPLDSVRGKLRPFEFAIDIVDAISGEELILDDVLANKEGVHVATVIAPSGNSVPITLTVKQDEKHQQLIGLAGTVLDENGNYEIKVESGNIALLQGYSWSNPEESVGFPRNDTTTTRPLFWQVIAAILAFIIVAILVWLVYIMTGGPSGMLEIVGRDSYGREEVVWSKKLSYFPRKNRIKSTFLKGEDVSIIYVKRTKSYDPDVKYAIYVSASDSEGIPIFDGSLDSGISESFIDVGDILYRHN